MTSNPHLKVQVWIYAPTPLPEEVQVLLLKTTTDRGSFWQPVTGKVEEGESLESAALREAQEETGLTFPKAPKDLKFEFQFESRWGGQATEHVFALEAPLNALQSEKIHLDPKEHIDYQWVPAAKAHLLLKFETNQRALQAFLNLFKGESKS